jgi:hypothetical protein
MSREPGTPLAGGLARVAEGLWVRPGFEREAWAWRAALASPAPLREPGTAGRGGARALPLPGGGRAWLKPHRHGGLLRGLLGEIYWEHPERPLREAEATEAARRAGVTAPEVLAAIVDPLPPPLGRLYRGGLVTREIAGRRSLAEALRESPPGERGELVGRCWEVLRRLHARGIRHRDANATNFLVGAVGEEPAIIDFDGAEVGDTPLGEAARLLARRRLARSVAKLGLPGLDRRAVAAILDARDSR